MKIVFPSYALNYTLSPFKSREDLLENGMDISYDKSITPDYSLYWGCQPSSNNIHDKYGVMETGFFYDAAFIDTVGSYHHCSLNSVKGFSYVASFDLNGRPSAKQIVNSLKPSQRSKFNPAAGNVKSISQPIILACQNPTDRSICFPHSVKKYWEFVEGCCKFYGKNLFVKLHPWNSNEKILPFQKLADKYGCGIGKCALDLIIGKDFVISFNSTIAIDCLLRDVPYVQYAMGTFWNSWGIHFSNYTFPKTVKLKPDSQKLADFLVYRYCFNKSMDKKKYTRMIKHFANSKDLFPINDEFCYANNLPK